MPSRPSATSCSSTRSTSPGTARTCRRSRAGGGGRPGGGCPGRRGPPRLTTSERLSCASSGLPWALVAEDGIQDHEELSHGGGQSKFAGPAGGNEASIEGGDDW